MGRRCPKLWGGSAVTLVSLKVLIIIPEYNEEFNVMGVVEDIKT